MQRFQLQHLLFLVVVPMIAGTRVQVTLGDMAILPCSRHQYESTPDDQLDITWQTQDQLVAEYIRGNLQMGPGFEDRVEANIEKLREGDFTLTIKSTYYNDGDNYECIWKKGSNVYKFLACVKLEILVPPSLSVPLHVPVGDPVTLSCFGGIFRQRRQDKINVHWQKDKQEVLQLKSGMITYGAGYQNRCSVPLNRIKQGNLSLHIWRTHLSDEGVYTCSYKTDDYTGEFGGIPINISLTVAPRWHNVSLALGETLNLKICTEGLVKVQFSKFLCTIQNNHAQWDVNYTRKAFVENNTLLLPNVTSADEGWYTVWDVQTNRTIITVFLSVTESHRASGDRGYPRGRWGIVFLVFPVLLVTVVFLARNRE